jgi:hypothetical protein
MFEPWLHRKFVLNPFSVVALNNGLSEGVSFFWGSSNDDQDEDGGRVIYRWKCRFCWEEYKDTNNDGHAPDCEVCHNKMKFYEKMYT